MAVDVRPDGIRLPVRTRHWVCSVLLIGGLVSCTADDVEPPGDASSGSPTTSLPTSTPTSTSTSTSMPQHVSRRQRIRQVLSDRDPDVNEVIALAQTPTSWTRGQDTLLVEHSLMPAVDWPQGGSVTAVQVLGRRGQVLGQWVDSERGAWEGSFWPAGRDFVGMTYDGRKPILIHDGAPTPLTKRRGSRGAEPGDIRFGDGWLLDRGTNTVTRERIEGCRRDTIRTDLDGRVWCLDGPKQHISWSDDSGRTWTRHRLSTTYFEYCDGGSLGVDLEVQGDVVAIGMWRADFSLDRGRTWRDVALPLRLVGSHLATAGSEANCTGVRPLKDGRLVISYFDAAVADDSTNTSFSRIRGPRGARYAGMHEGVLVVASRRPYGDRFASYDGGLTWQPLRISDLLRQLLPRDR